MPPMLLPAQARSVCKISPLCGAPPKVQAPKRHVHPRSQLKALEERQVGEVARSPSPASTEPFRPVAEQATAPRVVSSPTAPSIYRPSSSASTSSSSSPGFNPYPSSSSSSSFKASGSSSYTPSRPFPSPSQSGPRTYAPFYVYKTKGALCVSLHEPAWAAVPGKADDARLDRAGDMRLEFAIPSGGSDAGGGRPRMGQARAYGWDNKIQFAMSATELGTMVCGIGLEPGGAGIDFQHDPNMGTPQAGVIYKNLKIKRNPDSSVFVTLNQRDKATASGAPTTQNISVNLSPGEFQVFKSLASFAIPRLLGWDRDGNGMDLLGGDY
ncbi:MAG: hypothetical protein WDW36_007440 [Sanguina aurantia]